MLNKVWKEGKNCPLLKGVKWLGPLTCEDPLFLEQKSTHLYFPSRMFSKMELKLTLVDLVLVVNLPIKSFLFVNYLLYNNFFFLRESPHTAHLFIFWLSVSRVGTLMKLYWAQLRTRDRVTTCCVDVPSLVRVSKHNSNDQLFSVKSLWETWWTEFSVLR